jgi:hypothetical protein
VVHGIAVSTPPPDLAFPDARKLRDAFTALERARARTRRARTHRALVRLELAPYLVQVLLLPAFFIALLLELEPWLVAFWREFVMTWAGVLGIPVVVSARAAGWGELRLAWNFVDSPTLLPGRVALAWSAIASAGIFAGTYAIPARWLPLRYIARIVAVLLAVSTAVFAFGRFPYSIADHVLALTGGGFVLVATVPVMLALGYYVLRLPLALKLFHTALVMGYFVVLIPLQVVVHLVLVQHLTLVVMPMLFLVFGALLDFLLFIALYSWIASTAPPGAAASAPTAPAPTPP